MMCSLLRTLFCATLISFTPSVIGLNLYTSPRAVENESYDFVIVGGGTAVCTIVYYIVMPELNKRQGCVLAARLTEDPKVRVLMVEAGGEYVLIFNDASVCSG